MRSSKLAMFCVENFGLTGHPHGRDGNFKRAMAENSVERMRQYRYGEKRRETAR